MLLGINKDVSYINGELFVAHFGVHVFVYLNYNTYYLGIADNKTIHIRLIWTKGKYVLVWKINAWCLKLLDTKDK